MNQVYLYREYQITVNGTPPSGLSNTSGAYLQGQGSGHPGTNYVQTFGESLLAGPNMTATMSRATRARIRKTWKHELAYASRIATRIAKAAQRRTEARTVHHGTTTASDSSGPHAAAVDAVIGTIDVSRKSRHPVQ
jgi:hypothetical protein